MLAQLKRWISRGPAGPDLNVISEWAHTQGVDFKRVREGDGFALESSFAGSPWRLEWGPSQRSYIEGRELRMRIDLDLPQDLQMLVLNRVLMENLERSAFEQFTQSTQTIIDSANPEEMRWLAMFPKATLSGHKALRTRFGAVAPNPRLVTQWIEGPLAEQLERISAGTISEEVPFVLMTLRGRVYLRIQLSDPSSKLIAPLVKLFDIACQQALKVAIVDPESLNDGSSTAPAAWQATAPDSSQG
jgi:hypothetical protein